MNTRDYKMALNIHLLPVSEETERTRFMFQQDNAEIHCTNSAFEWFLSDDAYIINWPALCIV